MHREFNDLFLTSSSFKSEAPQLPFTADDRSINIQTPSNPVTNVVETIHGCKKISPTTKEDLSREMNLDSQEVGDPSSVDKDDKLLLSWDSLDKLKRRLVYDISPKVTTYINAHTLNSLSGDDLYYHNTGPCMSRRNGRLAH